MNEETTNKLRRQAVESRNYVLRSEVGQRLKNVIQFEAAANHPAELVPAWEDIHLEMLYNLLEWAWIRGYQQRLKNQLGIEED